MPQVATLYLVLATQELADTLSHAKAIQMGAGGPDDVTQYWWTQLIHPVTPLIRALVIGPPGSDFDATSLTPEYQAQLVDAATMIAAGWEL